MQDTNTLTMPKIIYGTAWKKNRTTDLVLEALKCGFRAIDTACQPKHYSEELVGKAIVSARKMGIERKDLFLQTKFTPLGGQDPNNIPYNKIATLREQVFESFSVSKRNLHTDYIDMYILHSPLFPFAHLQQVWHSMEQIAKSGEALNIGLSNCYDLSVLQKLYEQAEIKPAVLQNRFYDETGYDKEIRSWCNDHNIVYESFWTLSANPHILAHPILKELAQKHEKNEAQIFFAYLMTLGIVPLTGTTSTRHMIEDLKTTEIILDPIECESIAKLLV